MAEQVDVKKDFDSKRLWENIKEIKIKNYKSITEDFTGISNLTNINLIVGKNNIGKSTYLDIFKLTSLTNIQNKTGINNVKPEIYIKSYLEDKEIESHFYRNTSGGYIGGNHYEFGSQFINKNIGFIIKEGWKDFDIVHLDGYKNSYNRIDIFEKMLLGIFSDFQKHFYIKLSADRDLVSEIKKNEMTINENGSGATNVIRSFLNKSTLNSDIVEKGILNDLNKIMEPDNFFNRIIIQEIDDNENAHWEMFLETKNNQKVAISQSGSGLRTILLFLIKIHLEPKISNRILSNTVFVFEELENNLHPSILRNLIEFIYDWSILNNVIVIITTHSNVPINLLVNRENVSVTHIYKEGDIVKSRAVLDFASQTSVLEDLAVKASDLLQSNSIIWVEGPTDRLYINKWISVYMLQEYGYELTENLHYQFVYYGGRTLSHYSLEAMTNEDEVDFIKMLKVNRNSIVVMDSDKNNKQASINNTKKRILGEIENVSGVAWITKGKEIENYLSENVLTKTFDTIGKVNQYDTIVNYLNNQNNGLGDKYQSAKVKYSKKAIEYITYEDLIDNYDLYNQISKIANKIMEWNYVTINKANEK